MVRNQAKLAYNSVAAWLEGSGPQPERIAAVMGLIKTSGLQDQGSPEFEGLPAFAWGPEFSDD